MKKTKELEKSDKLIVGLATICALMLFSWLVYDIAFFNPQLEGQVAIGKIYEVQNRVKRKYSKSLIWYVAEQNETVYENDWIFTGSQSIAKIKLDSGGEIVVEPDSLIVLSRKNGVLELNLQHGRLLADVKKTDIKINVVQKGKVKAIDTSKGPIRVVQKKIKDPVDILKLAKEEASEEDLSLSDLANQVKKEDEEVVAVEEIADPKIHDLTYEQNNYFSDDLFRGQKTKVELNWSDPKHKWERYQLEIATDESFTEQVNSYRGKRSSFSFDTELYGDFKWRVRGINSLGTVSYWTDPIDLTVDITWKGISPPINLTKTKHRYKMLREELDKVDKDRSFEIQKNMKLSWENVEKAEHYKVQFSNDRNFTTVLREERVKQNKMKVEELQMGESYFRVIPETKEGIAMAEPSDGQINTFFPAPDKKSLKTIDKKDYQVLKWEKLPFAKTYQVSYRDSKESEPKVEYVKKNRLVVKNNTGYMQWKVRVVDPETKEQLGSQSVVVDWYDAAKRLASLHASGEEGTLYPKITKPAPRKTFVSINNSPLFIVMNWNYAKEAPQYEVEVSTKADMSEIVYKKRVRKKRKAVINRRFSPGVYFMRVRALGSDVTDDSWSEVEAFRVINRKAN